MNQQPAFPDPMATVHEALQQLGISLEATADSLREAEHWLHNDGISDPQLTDLTHLPFVTIDNEDSRDLDQAMFIDESDAGYQVMYALADASYYIRPGSALFNEALQRGTTYYTPALAAPMLPPALCEGLISLNPQVQRRSLLFDMQLDASARVTRCRVIRARIMSRAKLSYAGVQHWLDSATANEEAFHPSLQLLREVGNKLLDISRERGVVDFDRSESRVYIDGSPPRFKASKRSRFDTERYNEQLSLLCNMQGAELLSGLAGVTDALQAVFRVHQAPLKESLHKLATTLDAFASSSAEPALWRWKKGQSLADYVDSLPDDRQHQRQVRAVQRQIMMAQRGSTFTPEAGEHHALKAGSYARFSAPMREIVGIFTHKELLEALSGERFDNDADQMLREQVIEAANAARQRQRQLDKQIEFATLLSVFTADLNSPEPRWHPGTLMGFRTDKLYVSLDDMAIDVKVYCEDLEASLGTSYQTESVLARPSQPDQPVWRLGQGIELKITEYNVEKKRFIFAIRAMEDEQAGNHFP